MKKPLLFKYLIPLCLTLLVALSIPAYAESGSTCKHINHFIGSETCLLANAYDLGDFVSVQKPGFYPNPARSTIHLTHQENVNRVRIFSLTGKILIDVKIKSESINLSELPQGMYLINFDMKDGTRVASKLVKK